jgi:alpha,alpha-trehalose phosphorylase
MINKYLYKIVKTPLTDDEKRSYETLFHLANGYMGVRGCIPELGGLRGCYINGFYDIMDMKQAEPLFGFKDNKQVMVNALDVQGLEFQIDGVKLSLNEGMISHQEINLEMDSGSTKRISTYNLGGNKKLKIEEVRIIPFIEKHLFLVKYKVSTSFSCSLTIKLSTSTDVHNSFKKDDPRASSDAFKPMVAQGLLGIKGKKYLSSKTSRSNLTLSAIQISKSMQGELSSSNREENSTHIDDIFTYNMIENSFVTLEKKVVLVDSLRFNNLEKALYDLLDGTSSKTFDSYYKRQLSYMNDFWGNASVDVDGDDELNRAINYNLFSLKMSASQDGFGHLGAKGLSGEGYEGHYFWDTEMYVQDLFTFTEGDMSKRLLDFRWNTLEKAKDNAKRMGHHKGALYPWRTINGTECSGFFPQGSAQYHINGAVAHAIILYYLVTGDDAFMKEKGFVMLLEICRLYLDVGNFSGDKFMIHDVTGPDEYTALVSNNYYTNCCAKYDMEHLLLFSKELKVEIAAEEKLLFEKASSLMYLPYDEVLGISKQDENFLDKPLWDFDNTPKGNYPLLLHYHPLVLYRHQVCKQADVVLAHCLYPQYSSEEEREKSLDYYAKITTHDSSLSKAIYSVASSRLGRIDDALDYFGSSAFLDIRNLQGNTADGIHTANMGGCYMALVHGFASLQIFDDGIHISPILPKKWNGFSFAVVYKGCHVKINIKDKKINVLAKGKHTIHVYGKAMSFTDDGVFDLKEVN